MTRFYYTIFNLVALSVVVYTGVDIFYRVMRSELRQGGANKIVVQRTTDVEPQKLLPLSDFQVITNRNLFGSLEKTTEEVETHDIEGLEPTSLKIRLLGTVTSNQQEAFSVIEETDRHKQGLYKVGDSVQDAIVKIILRGKVVLTVGDRDEILTMEEPASPKTREMQPLSRPAGTGSTITLSHSDLQGSLKNINKLMTEVRVRPHFKNGKPDGLAVSRLKPNSIFAKLGLKNGDIIQGINGSPLTSPDDVLSLYKNLKSGSRISLQMSRKGESKTIDYEFK